MYFEVYNVYGTKSNEKKYSFGKKIMKVKVTQSCLTLCDPRDYTDHGIL